MKRCPECRRDYFDDSLLYCLEDGAALIQGSVPSPEEPETAILASSDGETRLFGKNAAYDQAQRTEDQSPRSTGLLRSGNARLAIGAALVALFAFAAAGYLYLERDTSGQINSIAVMPFSNDSGNVDLDYLSDGMTETLIGSLSQLGGLNVKSRSSVFRYKGSVVDPRAVGKDLGVQAVLNGRFVQRGDQITLGLELIDAQNDNVLWNDRYERKAADIVNLQSEIARDVSSKLKIKLTSADQLKLAKRYTNDPEVYRLYLQGRFYWNKRTPAEVAKGVPFFQQAVEKDPNFALGYVGLADSNEDTDRPRKKEYIKRALEIDDQLAEAHASLGYQLMMDYNWPESERELKRAIELNPNYPQAHQWNGARLMMIGKYDDARNSLLRALELDPTSPGINLYYGALLEATGRIDECIANTKKLVELEPTYPWPYIQLARAYRRNKDYAASVEASTHVSELAGNQERAKAERDNFAKGGWKAFLREDLKYPSGPFGASGFAELGMYDEAIQSIVRQSERRWFWNFMNRTDPFLDPIRDDPRFKEAMSKLDPPQ